MRAVIYWSPEKVDCVWGFSRGGNVQRSHRTPAAETSTRRLASRSQIEAGLPADLSATSCFIHGVEYLVLSHPIAPPAAPALEALLATARVVDRELPPLFVPPPAPSRGPDRISRLSALGPGRGVGRARHHGLRALGA